MASALARRAALALGFVYLTFGVLEVWTHRDDTVGALLFWGISLLGGGAAVLTGAQVWSARPAWGTVLVIAGSVLGLLATAWTMLIPLLAVAVVVLVVRELGTVAGSGSAQQRRETGPTTDSGDSGGQEGNASA